MQRKKHKIILRVLLVLLALLLLFLAVNVFALWNTYPHYRMTFGSYQRYPDNSGNTTIEACIMTGAYGFPLLNGTHLQEAIFPWFSQGYLFINNTTFAQYKEYEGRYREGSQIYLNIAQDDRHVRMEYTGYGVLPDGTQEPVHDVLDFSARWPWILFGAMPTLTRS